MICETVRVSTNRVNERGDKLARGTFNDLTGKRFGRLVVLKRVDDHISSGGYRYPKWKCLCDCGNKIDVVGKRLKSGTTKSCGCYRRDIASSLEHETHGDSVNPQYKRLYNIWRDMRRRCTTPTNQAFHHYGRRGISICEEWNDYTKFKEWSLANGYNDNLTICLLYTSPSPRDR